MKYIVIKKFTDKYTGEKYSEGRVLELTKKRANEILKVDKLIEKIEESNEE